MLIEVIIASTLAMTVAYYLLNITYKFKNATEDLNQSYFYNQAKILITKNIMSDLEQGVVTGFTESNSNNSKTIIFDFLITENNIQKHEKRCLTITNNQEESTIEYGQLNAQDSSFNEQDVSYYKKKIPKSLIINNININTEATGISISIPMQSIYSTEDYTIKLFANYITNT